MNFKAAQKDMRIGYYAGGTGALVSGLIWIAAGLIALHATQKLSILVFFFGGMLIHPLGVVLDKLLKRTGTHQKGNPLGALALESTLLIFIGLFIAYSVFQFKPNWFYPIMMLLIGGRYVIFQSVYGIRLYWVFGFALILLGVGFIIMPQPFYLGAIVGGAVEWVFALLLINGERNFK